MSNYYQFFKGKFEYEFKGILIRNHAGFMEEITDAWIAEGHESWERIYKITTKNKAVNLILFSSIDKRTNKVREIGSDAVRVVMQWKTKNGDFYKHIAKHYRIETLFKNLEKTILEAQGQVFNLNAKEFTKEVEA